MLIGFSGRPLCPPSYHVAFLTLIGQSYQLVCQRLTIDWLLRGRPEEGAELTMAPPPSPCPPRRFRRSPAGSGEFPAALSVAAAIRLRAPRSRRGEAAHTAGPWQKPPALAPSPSAPRNRRLLREGPPPPLQAKQPGPGAAMLALGRWLSSPSGPRRRPLRSAVVPQVTSGESA